MHSLAACALSRFAAGWPGLPAGGNAIERLLQPVEVVGREHFLGMEQDVVLVHPRQIAFGQGRGQFLADFLPSLDRSPGLAVGRRSGGHSSDPDCHQQCCGSEMQ